MSGETVTLHAPEAREPLWERLRGWLVQAYTQHGTLPAAQLASATTWLVFLSLLVMVLEGDHVLSETYHTEFFIAETIITALFGIDYVANVVLQKNRRGYILGPWGIIDLLAILPFFITVAHITSDPGAARTLQALRALRVLRVLKLAKVAEESAEQDATVTAHQPSFIRDLLSGLIVTCGILAVAEALGIDHSHHFYWLGFGSGFSLSISIRQWCIRHEFSPIAALLVMVTLISGSALGVLVDKDGDAGRASVTMVLTLAMVVVSWAMVEGRDGSL